MQKDFEVYKQYLETIKSNLQIFQNYYYHSIIDFNLIKLDSMLQNGILSKQTIENNKLPNIFTHSSFSRVSANGSNLVSLSEFTNTHELTQYYDAFLLHTLTSISLLISKNIEVTNKGEKETHFLDEVFSKDISINKIEGILIPSHIINKTIDELPCLCNEMGCYTRPYLTNLINVIETYFNKEIDREAIFNSLKQFWSIASKYEEPQKYIKSILIEQQNRYGYDLQDVISSIIASQYKIKYKKPTTSLDIIKELNSNNLPIYELGEKKLTKI